MDPEKDTHTSEPKEPEELKDLAEDPKTTDSPGMVAGPLAQQKKSKKKILILILGLILILSAVFIIPKFRHALLRRIQPSTTPSPTATASPTTAPTSTPNLLVRSEWSFEVLNGSGVTGQAKKVADKLIALGYQVVKVGNADKDNYPLTEVLVKKELENKIDLVIADLRDVVKIASVAGELKDSTASARIIIGKD